MKRKLWTTHHHFHIGCCWSDIAPLCRVVFQNSIAFLLQRHIRQHRCDKQHGYKHGCYESIKHLIYQKPTWSFRHARIFKQTAYLIFMECLAVENINPLYIAQKVTTLFNFFRSCVGMFWCLHHGLHVPQDC